jgi:sulfate permease, SulP family
VVLILTTAVVVVGGLENFGVDVLGEVQAGPPKLTWPDLSFAQWVQVIPSAAALTLVAMAEGLLVAKSYAQKREYPIHPNRDLFAFGAANISAGLTGGFTIGASTSRTAALDSTGSRTQLPALVAAVGTLLLLLFGTALLTDIPSAAIGAIVAVAVFGLLGFVELAAIYRVSRLEFVVGLTCFLGTLLLGPIVGIVIAFVLSLINLALRASKPPIDVLAQSEGEVQALIEAKAGVVLTAPGVVIVRFAAPLFFANAVAFDEAVRGAVEAARPLGLKHVVLDFEAITDIDVTGAASLADLRAWLVEQSFSVDYARVRPDILKLFAIYDLQGDSRIFPSNRDAVAALADGASEPAP